MTTTGQTIKGITSNTALTQEIERCANIMIKDRGGRIKGRNDVTFVIQSGGQKRDCLGHFKDSMWAGVDLESREYTDQRIHEIAIMAEHLNRDIYQVMTTLRHELVHLENNDNDCQDCSKGGAHNAKYFKTVAEECGLIVTHGKEYGRPGKGWAFTEPSEEFKVWIDTVVKPNIEVFNMARLQTAPAEKKESSMVTLTCDCAGGKEEPATLTMSRGAVQTRIDTDSLPQCPACEGTFKPGE